MPQGRWLERGQGRSREAGLRGGGEHSGSIWVATCSPTQTPTQTPPSRTCPSSALPAKGVLGVGAGRCCRVSRPWGTAEGEGEGGGGGWQGEGRGGEEETSGSRRGALGGAWRGAAESAGTRETRGWAGTRGSTKGVQWLAGSGGKGGRGRVGGRGGSGRRPRPRPRPAAGVRAACVNAHCARAPLSSFSQWAPEGPRGLRTPPAPRWAAARFAGKLDIASALPAPPRPPLCRRLGGWGGGHQTRWPGSTGAE